MTWKKLHHPLHIALFLLSIFLLTACTDGTITLTPNVPDQGATKTVDGPAPVTNTPLAPPTMEPDLPLAVSVNGQGITLEEYHVEVELALAASENGLMIYTEDDVLQNLIDEVLLAQGAREAGFMVDDNFIQARIDQLGLDETALQDWITDHGYSPESFERSLSRSVSAAWMRDQIIAQVPSTAEQVHARQILLYNSDEAESIYAQLQAGTDFATLATQYDPLAAGELGWFPPGYLTVPELDDPVFSLQAGEYTEIIETVLGFHIVQVIERDSQRPLSPGAYQTLKVRAVQDWLVERRGQSDIQIFVGTSH